MDTPVNEPFELVSQRLGALPLINHFLDRAGLGELLNRYLPTDDTRLRISPASAVLAAGLGEDVGVIVGADVYR